MPITLPQAPTSTGIPLRTLQVPTADNPALPATAGGVIGGAVTQLGQQVQQVAETSLRTQAVNAQVQKAQDTLDAKLASQNTQLRLQGLYDELQQGDYRTLPETFLTQSKEVVKSVKEGMTPNAAALYEVDALQQIAVFQQRAFATRTARRDQDTAYSLQREASQYTDQYVNAPNDFERIVARVGLRQTYDQYVSAGLIHGAQAEAEYQRVIKAADLNRLELLNRAAPQQMLQHYNAIQRGEAGLPGVPTPDRAQLVTLIDDAERQYRESLEVTHRGDVQAEKAQGKIQMEKEGQLRGELYSLVNTVALPEAYAAFRNDVEAQRKAGTLSTNGAQELLSLSMSLQNAAAYPREPVDDVRTRNRFEFGISAPSPQYPWPTVEELQIAAEQSKLKPETVSSLLRQRTAQLDESHYSKVYEAQQGKARVREAITQIIGYVDVSGGLELNKSAQMTRYLEADKLFDAMLQYAQDQTPTPQGKRDIVRQISRPVADQIIQAYAPHLTALAQNQLPKLRYGLEEVFTKEGISKAIQATEAMKNTLSPVDFDALRKNLKRREELKWVGGEPIDPKTVPEPSGGIWDWFKSWFPASQQNAPTKFE